MGVASLTMPETRWRVFRGGLTGRVYAAKCRYVPETGHWIVVGVKHDVTDDVTLLTDDRTDGDDPPP